MFRLAPGKMVEDVLRFLEHLDGPLPGEPMGGTTAISRGVVNFVTADFTPGDYALLCLVADATDGLPHVAHGMVDQIHVE